MLTKRDCSKVVERRQSGFILPKTLFFGVLCQINGTGTFDPQVSFQASEIGSHTDANFANVLSAQQL